MRKRTYSFTIILFLALLSATTGFCEQTRARQLDSAEEALCHKIQADGFVRQGKADEAIQEYEKALAFSAGPATYFNLAIAYYEVRNIPGAIASLEKLVELDPQDVEAQYNLACLKLQECDVEGARLCFERAKLSGRPDSPFSPLVDRGLGFLKELENTDPAARKIILLLLRQLPALALAEPN